MVKRSNAILIVGIIEEESKGTWEGTLEDKIKYVESIVQLTLSLGPCNEPKDNPWNTGKPKQSGLFTTETACGVIGVNLWDGENWSTNKEVKFWLEVPIHQSKGD